MSRRNPACDSIPPLPPSSPPSPSHPDPNPSIHPHLKHRHHPRDDLLLRTEEVRTAGTVSQNSETEGPESLGMAEGMPVVLEILAGAEEAVRGGAGEEGEEVGGGVGGHW